MLRKQIFVSLWVLTHTAHQFVPIFSANISSYRVKLELHGGAETDVPNDISIYMYKVIYIYTYKFPASQFVIM